MKPAGLQHVERLATARMVAVEPVPPPGDLTCGEVLSWTEVNRTHRTRNGIYHRHESLISLLTDFGRINACYPDRVDESGEMVRYTGEGRHGDQRLSPGNRALLAAIETNHSVPLFNKLSPGRWQHTGWWRVTSAEHRFDERENRMLWWFTLQRVAGGNS